MRSGGRAVRRWLLPVLVVVVVAGACDSETGDYGGTSAADPVVFFPEFGRWDWSPGLDGEPVTATFDPGAGDDIPLSGDYDGDRLADYGVYRPPRTGPGRFLVWSSATQAPVLDVALGLPGDVPAPADYDADGRSDPAVYRSSDASFHVVFSSLSSGGSNQAAVPFGAAGDLPVPGDTGDDGWADFILWRPTTGEMGVLPGGGGAGEPRWFSFGGAGTGDASDHWDIPVVADFDGDGRDDPAIFRRELHGEVAYLAQAGTFLYRPAAPDDPASPGDDPDVPFDTEVSVELTVPAAASIWLGDVPVPKDYDGDGVDDPAVFRLMADEVHHPDIDDLWVEGVGTSSIGQRWEAPAQAAPASHAVCSADRRGLPTGDASAGGEIDVLGDSISFRSCGALVAHLAPLGPASVAGDNGVALGWTDPARCFRLLCAAVYTTLGRVADGAVDHVVVNLGTNDVYHAWPLWSDATARLEQVVVEVLAADPDVCVHLVTISSEAATTPERQVAFDGFAASLAQLATDARVELIDWDAQVHGPPPDPSLATGLELLEDDRLHPSRLGQDTLARLVAGAVADGCA